LRSRGGFSEPVKGAHSLCGAIDRVSTSFWRTSLLTAPKQLTAAAIFLRNVVV
jgi:hypothetical protein